MKPAQFEYHRPSRIDEALDLLVTLPDAKLIAGGQSLVPIMNTRMSTPSHIVDINRLPGLNFIELDNDTVRIGSLTRHHDIATSPILAACCPILARAAATIGHYAIRQRGTIGGSLVHADPAAQLPLLAALFDGKIRLASKQTTRILPASEFFISIFQTVVEQDELLLEIDFCSMKPEEGWGYRLISARAGDFALVSMAATLEFDKKGRVAAMRLAAGGVEAVPVDLFGRLQLAVGAIPDSAWITMVARKARECVDPMEDASASARLRCELVEALCARVLNDCFVQRLGGAAS